MCTVMQAVNGELACGFTAGLLFSLSNSSSVLHNSDGGGTVWSADYLIKFLLLQPHLHVHAVMFTQEA